LHGLGNLNVAALINAAPHDYRLVKALQLNGHIDAGSLIQISDFAGGKEADIEDLLDAAFYCTIVSGAYGKELPGGMLKPADLKSRLPRITARVSQYFTDHHIGSGAPDRYQLATYFLREQQTFLPELSTTTLKRAAKMFERINRCAT
jgi:hypothetical protein